MTETFEILRTGVLATVQDLGRWDYQRFGMPVSGAMDGFALRAANLLVGNTPGEAAVEIAMGGLTMRAMRETVVAICGADLRARLDGRAAPMWKSFAIRQGQELSWDRPAKGAWAYLAVAGGIDVPSVMGSKSTYLRAKVGGLEGRALAKGDVLVARNQVAPPSLSAPVWALGGVFRNTPDTPKQTWGCHKEGCHKEECQRFVGRGLSPTEIPEYSSSVTARVILGPQQDAFEDEAVRTLCSSEYEVTAQSDRMGYRLKGPPLRHKNSADILSDALTFGSIQVPADGQPILLTADHQTTGGYAKIATVISADLSAVVQLGPGGKLRFEPIDVRQAQDLARQQEQLLARLEVACSAS
jgi:antagonist of KipI